MSLTEVLTEREIKVESEVSKRILSYPCSCRLLCESFFTASITRYSCLNLRYKKYQPVLFLFNVLPLSLVRLLIYNKTFTARLLFCLTFAVGLVQQDFAQADMFRGNLHIFILFDVFQSLFEREDHRRSD